MGKIALQVYKGLTNAGEDKDRASVIAEGFEGMESRLQITVRANNEAFSTREDLNSTELRLLREIENTRQEIEKTRLEIEKSRNESRLEFEQVRKEVKELDLRHLALMERSHERYYQELKEFDQRSAGRDLNSIERDQKSLERDLKTQNDLKQLEVKLAREMNRLSWNILAGMTAIATFFTTAIKILNHFGI